MLEVRSPELLGTRREEVEAFLIRYGEVLSSDDAASVASMWGVPALVLSDAGLHPVTSLEEIHAFFRRAADEYESRGIVATRPMVLRLEWLSERIAIVEVRWSELDAKDCEVGQGITTYTLRYDDAGALRIHVAIMHGS